MTQEEQIKVCEKVSRFIWEEFDKHDMELSDAMIIVSAVVDYTISMLCKMTGEDYKETIKYFCDTLVENSKI